MNLWKSFALPRLFRRTNQPRRKPARFRPSVLTLEDRTVPAGSDMFAGAGVLTGTFATDTGSNVGATAEPGEPDPNGSGINSVWWQWTAPASGSVEVSTAGSDFDTNLAVYTGSAVDQLTLVGANDDYYDLQSSVVFDAVAGTTYHFGVNGFQGASGNVALSVGMQPANDNFASATAFTGGSTTGWNLAATGEAGEPTPVADSDPVNSVWWSWTAPASGSVEVDTNGSNFDTTLAVYTGSAVDQLTLVAANDDYDTVGGPSRVTFNAVAGTTYSFAVDGFEEWTGAVVLNMPTSPAPANQPPVIGDQAFAVNENSAAGTVVGMVAASDPDAGQTLTYAITGGNASGAFAIDSATGRLTVANSAPLDYETTPSFALTVQVTDSGSPALATSATITVNLNDVNEAPAFTGTGPFRVNANSPAGTVVGTVAASDPDHGQTLTYSIVGGNTGGAFAIDPATGQLTVANSAALDYGTNPSFALTVQVTDSSSPALSSTATVAVGLNQVNSRPVIGNQTFSIKENSPVIAVVGWVAASDPDAGQTLTYAITGGNTGGAFSIDPATGRITVANPAALDYETTPVFTLTVQVTDNGSPPLSASATVTVDLIDVNEAPAFTGTGPFRVNENSAAGTAVGTVAASDPDHGQMLTYAITGGNASGAFAIDSATGQLTVANSAPLDYEVTPTFSLTVQVTDNGSPALSSTATVTVNLNDVNDAPVLDNSGSMSLHAINMGQTNNSGTLVSDILASAGGNRITDEDAGALQGIAIIGADTSHGSWQFSTDGGATWTPLGAVSDGSARLLNADANTRVRFVPGLLYSGTVTNGITFRAWDRTSGTNGGLGKASTNGGTTAFSTATETASITVHLLLGLL